MVPLRGPLRVRALVWVRCPRTGNDAAMPVAAVALNIDEALDVHLDVLAEIALDVTLVLNHLADAVYLFFAEILDLLEGINIRLLQDLQRARDRRCRKMYVSAIRACLLRGRSTPAIRAILNSFAASGYCASGLAPVRTGYCGSLRGSSQALTQAN